MSKHNFDMVRILTNRSFRANRLRNFITVVAIMLTGILFTSVTTIGIGAQESLTLSAQMAKMSRGDAEIHKMTREQFQKLKQSDMVKKVGLRMPVGYLTNSKNHNVEVNVADRDQMDLAFCAPTHGKVQSKANEIVTSAKALRSLGVEPEVGAEVTIQFTVRGKPYQFPMVVSGWFESNYDSISIMCLSWEFVKENPQLFPYTYRQDREITGTYSSDFLVKNQGNIQGQLDQFVKSIGGSTSDMNADNFIQATVNQMSNPGLNPTMLAAVIVFIILFVACGYLLIFNVFDIAVMQEIRRYGLYRTIGMSRKQVKKMINRQAATLSLVGIPLGLIIGYFVGKAILPQIVDIIAAEYENVGVNVSPNPLIFAGAALLTALTVFLSTRKPIKSASNASPLEAFQFTEHTSGRRTKKKGKKEAGIANLAWSNLGRNRRRTAFIITSLLLSVTLLNVVGTVAKSLDVEKQVNLVSRTDFAIMNSNTSNNMIGFTKRSDALDGKAVDAVKSRPGVKEGAVVYKNTKDDTNTTFDIGVPFETTESNENGRFGITRDDIVMRLGNNDYPVCNVYGTDATGLSRLKIIEGEQDFTKLYEKLRKGQGVIVGVQAEQGSYQVNDPYDFLQVGDVVTAYIDGRTEKQYPVLAKVAIHSDDYEVGLMNTGSVEVGMDSAYLYFPQQEYKKLYAHPTIMKYAFNVEEEKRAEMKTFLTQYIDQSGKSISVTSAEEARKAAEATRTMIYLVGGLVGIIFGLSGILNLINVLITSILVRRHEFATMESLGMNRKQMTQMVTLESVSYVIIAAVTGIMVAAVLNSTVVKGICSSWWQFTYQGTLLPAAGVCIVLLVFAWTVPKAVLKIFNKGSIIEKLRITE